MSTPEETFREEAEELLEWRKTQQRLAAATERETHGASGSDDGEARVDPIQPAPKPASSRPPDSRSIVASDLANTTGWW